MRDKLRTLLGIQSGEESMVSMLLTQSVFIGIFIGSFDITAHSLLLSSFDEKMMARGYIVSGILGIILTYFYSWVKTRVQLRSLLLINLLFIFLITLCLRAALFISPLKGLIFIIFVMFGPLNILILLGFRSVTEQISTLQNGRRYLQLTDSGLIIGAILISFLIPFLLSVRFQLVNILLLSAVSVFLTSILQIFTGKSSSLAITSEVQYSYKPENSSSFFNVFHTEPLLRIICAFIALSVLATFFIQYSFLAITREQYPVAENMAGFLGIFTGSILFFLLFLRIVFFDYILHNYGMRVCLVITPFLLIVITSLVITLGTALGYSSIHTGSFILFFTLLAAGRFISRFLKESVETPSLKIIYQSLDRIAGLSLNTGTTVSINEIMVFFSGLILTGLGLFSFIKLIHFSLFLLIIVLLWLFVAYRLYKEYRKSIVRTVEKSDETISENKIPGDLVTFKNRFSAHLAFRKNYFSLISDDYSSLNNISNNWYYDRIIHSAESNKDLNLIPVLKKTISNPGIDENIRLRSAEVVKIIQESFSSLRPGGENIGEAIRTLSGTRKPQTAEILRLFRGNTLESKRLAIYMIGKFGLSDLLSEVCASLGIPGLAIDASVVLKSFGSGIEHELVRYYLITSGNPRLSKIILNFFGKNSTKETKGFLFSRLWSNSRQLKETAINCLVNCNYRANEEEKQRLDQLTSETIGIITWYLAARISLEREYDNFLLGKINLEIDRWNTFLINLLSITYNQGSVAGILDNIHKGTVESASYAIEMTDIVVSAFVKPKLVYFLDVVPDEVKLKNLFQFFPGEIPTRKKLLEEIINRDYNLISLWTKACTLRTISKIESEDMAESVSALLFSPEEIIREEAVSLISRSKPEIYTSVAQRLSDPVRRHLDSVISGSANKNELLFEKVRFLSIQFCTISEEDLFSLASEMKYAHNFEPLAINFQEGLIVWILSDAGENEEVHILYEGEIEGFIRNKRQQQNISFYYLPLVVVEFYYSQFPDNTIKILKYIDDHT